jgi:hypothetical protein
MPTAVVHDSSHAGLTRVSIQISPSFYQDDGLHQTSGLPEVRTYECRKSGKPDLPGNDEGDGRWYYFCWIADTSQCPPRRRMNVQISVASSGPP